MQQKIVITNTVSELSNNLARNVTALMQEQIQSSGRVNIALSGGNTPKALYELLASDAFKNNIQWESIHFYFGDERAVPHDHEESNFYMVQQAMFSKVPIPERNIHAIEANPEKIQLCAQRYNDELVHQLPKNSKHIPYFDLVLLGMGEDGHTASLFPDTSILSEQNKCVEAVYVDKLGAWRVSLCYPIINSSKHIMILVAGENKARVLREVLLDNNTHYPIQRVKNDGVLEWYLDSTAASELPENIKLNGH